MTIEDIWKQYKEHNDITAKNNLIESYIHLVKIVAGRLYNYYGGNIDYDDLVGYGVFGLIDAIEKFDIYRDLRFETYAQIRIRGSVIDSIRKIDWIPRSLRKKSKELETVITKLENRLNRAIENEDIARELKKSKKEVEETLSEIATFNTVSFEEILSVRDEVNIKFYDDNIPEDIYQKKELKEALQGVIDQLPYKEKMVISLYYYNELTYKEIGTVLELSESRISQIHSKALLLIKSKIYKYI